MRSVRGLPPLVGGPLRGTTNGRLGGWKTFQRTTSVASRRRTFVCLVQCTYSELGRRCEERIVDVLYARHRHRCNKGNPETLQGAEINTRKGKLKQPETRCPGGLKAAKALTVNGSPSTKKFVGFLVDHQRQTRLSPQCDEELGNEVLPMREDEAGDGMH
eukprot:GHVT01086151.1.p1 GENE.GHVT01086151.1~~GHVT01086151.1.p1  ORF type:complete len:160 (+),score=9.70 GHVT01086151.1:306-785(+)